MKRLLILGFLLFVSPAFAQNPQCPTRPAGDSTNACASTSFVQNSTPGVITPTVVADGVTDNTTVLQAAISSLALTGGSIRLPVGTICVNGGITIATQSIHLIGTVPGFSATVPIALGTNLSACGAEVTPLTINAANVYVSYIRVMGNNSPSTTHDTIVIGSSCNKCKLFDVDTVWGLHGVSTSGSDTTIQNGRFAASYGSANVYANGGQAYILRVAPNNQFAAGAAQPAIGTAINNWVALTPYSANDIVKLPSALCGGSGCIAQTVAGGTSGGSQPTALTFGTPFTDGSIIWVTLGAITNYGIQSDSSNSVLQVETSDASGPHTAGIGITSTATVSISNATPGNYLSFGVLISGNASVTLSALRAGSCVTPNCSGISVTGATANVQITSAQIANVQRGLDVQGGSVNVNGGYFNTTSGTGINIAAGVKNFNIIGIQGATNTDCIDVAVGGSDNYNIVYNNCVGATNGVTDGGTGVKKNITGNLH